MASASHINIKIALNDDYVATCDRIARERSPARLFAEIIENLAAGLEKGKVLYNVEHTTTAAAQTVTFDSSDGVDGDYLTICGLVFTVKTSPNKQPQSGEFLLYADNDTAQGAAFATAWNSHPFAQHIGTAVNVAGVVTITMLEGGTIGNTGALSTSNADFAAVGGALFESGDAGTVAKQLSVDPLATTIL